MNTRAVRPLKPASRVLIILLFLVAVPAAAERFTDEAEQVGRVLTLMDQRLALMPDVAAWKWQQKAPVTDPQREQVVVNQAAAQAEPLGLAAEPVRGLFEVQIMAARAVQERLIAQWQQQGGPAGEPVVSLEKELRPRLDQLTRELLVAVYLAAPALERPDFATRYADAVHRELRNDGWSEQSRRQVLTALSAIRHVPVPALDRIRAAGVVRVGTTGDYAPFSLEENGELRGADIDLASSLAQALNTRVIFVKTTWSALMNDLQAGHFDLAMSGISVTPARAAVAAFSESYATAGKTIISRCRDARRFTELAAVNQPGVRVVVNPGGTNEAFVREHVGRASVRVHPDNRTIFEEIRAGRADVMITDDVEVELQIRRHRAELCRPMRDTLTRADKAVLMPRDAALQAAVGNWLSQALRSRQPGRLIERHLSP